VRDAIVCWGLVLAFGGCAALTGVKGGADAAKGAADDAKGQKDAASATAKDEKDKAKGDKGGAGGAGESPAGPSRLEATEGQINAPISDKIDVKKAKQNDWRKFQLLGKSGYATFELHWDEEGANLSIDVFDKFGVNIGKSPRRIEGQSEKKILLKIDDPGLYYVRVSGPQKTDSSIYTMMVKWKGPAAPPATAAAAPAPAPAPAAGGAPAAPAPAPCTPGPGCVTAPDPNKVYGSIVSMVREGSTVTLYLDKGSADQLHAGMMGMILDGPEGDKPFEGGSFSIAQVVGGSKSIAKSSTLQKPIGKNKRIVVNLK
jgi:hypothetical protein